MKQFFKINIYRKRDREWDFSSNVGVFLLSLFILQPAANEVRIDDDILGMLGRGDCSFVYVDLGMAFNAKVSYHRNACGRKSVRERDRDSQKHKYLKRVRVCSDLCLVTGTPQPNKMHLNLSERSPRQSYLLLLNEQNPICWECLGHFIFAARPQDFF